MSTSKKVTVFAAPTLPFFFSQRFPCCYVYVVWQWSRRYFGVFPLRFFSFLLLVYPCGLSILVKDSGCGVFVPILKPILEDLIMQWMMRCNLRSEEVGIDVRVLVGRIRACGFRGDRTRQRRLRMLSSTLSAYTRHTMSFLCLLLLAALTRPC